MLFESLVCQSPKITVLFYIKRKFKKLRGLGCNRFLVAFGKLLQRVSRALRHTNINSGFNGSHAF